MNPLLDGWVYTVGWTLVHFVWQGAAIALLTATALAACRRRSSQARYVIACLGLAALLAAPVITAVERWTPPALPIVSGARSPGEFGETSTSTPGAAVATPEPLRATAMRTSVFVEAWLPVVVWAWLAGVALLLARFAGASWRVRQLHLASFDEPLSRWQATAERLATRLRLEAAFRIVESALVDVPSVIGTIRPVVFLPVAALTSLTPDQIEALLAHELAHIRRRDYAVNIAQTVAEALLFFHPAVWWMSARIREEREHCCDDIAVELCGEPVAYASALAELAAWRTRELALSLGATDGALLARVRRILRPADTDLPRAASGPIVLALGLLLVGGVAVQSASQKAAGPAPNANERIVTVKTRNASAVFALRTTDHFQVFYPRELDLHAERVAREAEVAYDRISADLRHNLASRVPVFLVRTEAEIDSWVNKLDLSSADAAISQEPSDHVFLAMDQPADQWLGTITHEVAHVFSFDILPAKSTASWIREGLSDNERGSWDPNDLAAVRDAVRSNAVPAMSRLQPGDGKTPRLVTAFGHAVFDFIESRSGKAGVRQFLFALRKTADTGADPFEAALQMNRDAFDRAFEAYLRERFATVANQLPRARADVVASQRVEGEVTTVSWPVADGLACVELWVPSAGAPRQRWAIECGAENGQRVTDALKPGDRVIVTGPLARGVTAQRLTLESLTRPADGFTWRTESR